MKVSRHLIRLSAVSLFLGIVSCILIWRLLDLMVLDRQFLKEQGDARSLRIVDIPAYRGMITDRNGVPLAVSTPVQSVWVNPKTFAPDNAQLAALARLLKVSPALLKKEIKKHQAKEFLYIRRQLQPQLTDKIDKLHIPGINFQQEYRRYYPQLASAAQLVGFTNIDDRGLEGLELAYEEWLKGENGKKRVIKNRLGQIVEELGMIKQPRPGRDLPLSIDAHIQYLAYQALMKTCAEFAAKSGSVIVLDAKTGEVLAVTNYPSFNPNTRFRYPKAHYRNRAMVDLFEPGSVIKPFSIASALETKKFKPNTIIDTRPSWMVVQGRLIRDIHDYGVLDVTGVLENSSNVGVTKMVLASPPEQLLNLLHRVGFGEVTGSAYPGESEGSIVKKREAGPFVLATVGFGYGVSVTPMQLAKAYLVFANHGKIFPVSLIAGQAAEEKKQVLSEKAADDMLMMMESVSEFGTGRSARVAGYRMAGKTGTARIAGNRGYEEHRHIASFVGIAPVSDPKLIVVAVVQEPTKKGYYGAAVAAPLFAETMAGALRILNISPDKV